MTLWEKIKCLVGICPVTKEQEKAVMDMYKPEPRVQKITAKAQKKMDEIVADVKVEKAKVTKKAKTIVDEIEDKVDDIVEDVQEAIEDVIDEVADIVEDVVKVIKAKRSWYNNGKKQQLVTAAEVDGLPKTWKKGKIKKDK